MWTPLKLASLLEGMIKKLATEAPMKRAAQSGEHVMIYHCIYDTISILYCIVEIAQIIYPADGLVVKCLILLVDRDPITHL